MKRKKTDKIVGIECPPPAILNEIDQLLSSNLANPKIQKEAWKKIGNLRKLGYDILVTADDGGQCALCLYESLLSASETLAYEHLSTMEDMTLGKRKSKAKLH